MAAISNLTVYANLQVLSRLSDGNKLNIDRQTGALTKHIPHRGETLTRWYFGAFNTETVQQTFSRAFELIELEDGESDHVKTYGHLSELIPSALTGVKTLKATYDGEKKTEVSGQLDRIHGQFEKQYGQIKKKATTKNAPPSDVADLVEVLHDTDGRSADTDDVVIVEAIKAVVLKEDDRSSGTDDTVDRTSDVDDADDVGGMSTVGLEEDDSNGDETDSVTDERPLIRTAEKTRRVSFLERLCPCFKVRKD